MPLAVIGTRQVMPKGRLRTEPADVRLIVHDPIQPPAIDAPTAQDAKALADRVHRDRCGGRARSADAKSAFESRRSQCIVTAIIAAGGRGLRFGGARPKQLLSVDGRTLLERSVGAFLAHPSIDEVVVALPADIAQDPPAYLRGAAKPLRIVAGGARRQDSVSNAFRRGGRGERSVPDSRRGAAVRLGGSDRPDD